MRSKAKISSDRRTERLAHMSLTHTAELNHVDPFDYLVQLQRHANDLQADPASWLPWNYRDTLAVCSSGADPPD